VKLEFRLRGTRGAAIALAFSRPQQARQGITTSL
jgi:hypothetical protein